MTGRSAAALVGAIAMAIALFLLVPLTQMLGDLTKQPITFRQMAIANAPPPKAPPSPEQEQVEPEEKPPELQESFQELSLNQLELALNPGLGDALAMGASSLALNTEIDIMEQVEQIFQFSDLDGVPHMISQPRFDFPHALERRGIKLCKVELLISIDETGLARVEEVVSASHPEIVSVAQRLIERARFTIPKYGGKPVSVIGNIPLTLEAKK